jgi:hypothetical protein
MAARRDLHAPFGDRSGGLGEVVVRCTAGANTGESIPLSVDVDHRLTGNASLGLVDVTRK